MTTRSSSASSPAGPAGRIREALASAASLGLERLDGQLLLLHALGRPVHERAWLVAHDTDALPSEAERLYDDLCRRRATGEPLAYLIGRREFHGLDLQVDARVLIPRPDTETLVDWALERLAPHATPRVLDLGTGSGAIALALKAARPDAQVSAFDCSEAALDVARGNALRLGLDLCFVQSDWLAAAAGTYTLIVSNPPYIAAGDGHLSALRHEPIGALVAGADGLSDLRRIVRDAPQWLGAGASLLLEHGHDQAAAVRALLREWGFDEVQSRDDLAGIERCSGGIWPAVK